MQRFDSSRFCLPFLSLTLLVAVGCNDAGQSTEIADSTGTRSGSLPLLSVGEVPAQPVTDFTAGEPTLAEPTEAAPAQGEPGNPGPQPVDAPAMTQAEVDLARALQLWAACQSESMEETVRHDNLMQIVDRTSNAMTRTRGNANQIDVFNMAAVTLANARMQLALADDTEDNTHANMLSQSADELFRTDPTSMGATETAYRVVELSREMAERHLDQQDTQWSVGYARQSRLFAQRFPQESQRVPISLIAAGEMCEHVGLMDEARQCYSLLKNSFPDSLLSTQADRMLRRLDLVGQPIIGFAGETLAGNTLDVADLKGHTVVIVFWSSDNEEFQRQHEQIQIWKEMHGDNLQIVGVNLDTDETAVRDFVETRGFPGENIFYNDSMWQGESHPLVVQFAVNEVPSYWLISAEGIVMGAPIGFDDLNDTLTQPVE